MDSFFFLQTSQVPGDQLGHLPSDKAMKMVMIRELQRTLPPNPASLAELVIPPALSVSADNVPWILTNEMFGGSRLVIFAHPRSLEFLGQSSVLRGDGTFDLAPQSRTDAFTQL